MAFDKVYADAMRSLWRQFPDDPDAGVLFAEVLMNLRPWDLWRADGLPKPAYNGWAFFSLTQNLRAQQKSSEAETVEQQF